MSHSNGVTNRNFMAHFFSLWLAVLHPRREILLVLGLSTFLLATARLLLHRRATEMSCFFRLNWFSSRREKVLKEEGGGERRSNRITFFFSTTFNPTGVWGGYEANNS